MYGMVDQMRGRNPQDTLYKIYLITGHFLTFDRWPEDACRSQRRRLPHSSGAQRRASAADSRPYGKRVPPSETPFPFLIYTVTSYVDSKKRRL
jgi:hypothetical protein